MKKMIALAALLVSFGANAAVNANSSWSQILADNSVAVDGVLPVFGPTGIFNACTDGTNLKSIKPVTVCVETQEINLGQEGGSYSVCVKSAAQAVSMPLSGTHFGCLNYTVGSGETGTIECTQYGQVPYTISLNQNVNVTSASGESYGSVLFSKAFTIPACAQ